MRFREKQPVEIEAIRFADASDAAYKAVLDWVPGSLERQDGVIIPTLAGDHLAQPGDWIIMGAAGEFYPCKPDIFEATYEPAEPYAVLDGGGA